MRVVSLNIDGYKMFNPSPKIKLGKEIQLLIGVNGSGKSTILEAIAILFAEVKEYCEDPKIRERKFNFSIEYSFNVSEILEQTSTSQNSKLSIKHIVLSSSKETGLPYSMYVDGEEIKTPQEMYKYLPDNLIFYYAGACDTLERIIDLTEDEQAKELYGRTNEKNIAKVIERILKNIVYIRKDYYPLLFMLNYIDKEHKLPLNNKEFTIRNIRFYIKQYRYTKNTDYKNLFNLTGFLRLFMDNLLKHSYDGVEFDKEKGIAFFDIGFHRGILEAVEDLPNLSDEQKYNQTRFLAFHFISLLFRIGMIKKIDIAIDQGNNTYSIDDLSEGEQQLILLDSIKKVICQNNSVLFLDEPDAYLHPQRQRELIPHLKEIFTESYTQIIATSHSPFVAQSVRYDSILLFDQKGGFINNEQNLLDTEVITNVLFGVNDRFKETIESDLDKFRLFREHIFQDEQIDIVEFRAVVTRLQNYGEETKVIMARELTQLNKLKNFDINGAVE